MVIQTERGRESECGKGSRENRKEGKELIQQSIDGWVSVHAVVKGGKWNFHNRRSWREKREKKSAR